LTDIIEIKLSLNDILCV